MGNKSGDEKKDSAIGAVAGVFRKLLAGIVKLIMGILLKIILIHIVVVILYLIAAFKFKGLIGTCYDEDAFAIKSSDIIANPTVDGAYKHEEFSQIMEENQKKAGDIVFRLNGQPLAVRITGQWTPWYGLLDPFEKDFTINNQIKRMFYCMMEKRTLTGARSFSNNESRKDENIYYFIKNYYSDVSPQFKKDSNGALINAIEMVGTEERPERQEPCWLTRGYGLYLGMSGFNGKRMPTEYHHILAEKMSCPIGWWFNGQDMFEDVILVKREAGVDGLTEHYTYEDFIKNYFSIEYFTGSTPLVTEKPSYFLACGAKNVLEITCENKSHDFTLIKMESDGYLHVRCGNGTIAAPGSAISPVTLTSVDRLPFTAKYRLTGGQTDVILASGTLPPDASNSTSTGNIGQFTLENYDASSSVYVTGDVTYTRVIMTDNRLSEVAVQNKDANYSATKRWVRLKCASGATSLYTALSPIKPEDKSEDEEIFTKDSTRVTYNIALHEELLYKNKISNVGFIIANSMSRFANACYTEYKDRKTGEIMRDANKHYFSFGPKTLLRHTTDGVYTNTEKYIYGEIARFFILDKFYDDNIGYYHVDVLSGLEMDEKGSIEGKIREIEFALLGTPKPGQEDDRADGLLAKIFNNLLKSDFASLARAALALYVAVYGFRIITGFGNSELLKAKTLIPLILKIAVLMTIVTENGFNLLNKTVINLVVNGTIGLVDLVASVFYTNASMTGEVNMFGSPGNLSNVSNVLSLARNFAVIDEVLYMFSTEVFVVKIFSYYFSKNFLITTFGVPLLLYTLFMYIKTLIMAVVPFLTVILQWALSIPLAPVMILFSFFEFTKQFFKNWVKFCLSKSIELFSFFTAFYLWTGLINDKLKEVLYFKVCIKRLGEYVLKIIANALKGDGDATTYAALATIGIVTAAIIVYVLKLIMEAKGAGSTSQMFKKIVGAVIVIALLITIFVVAIILLNMLPSFEIEASTSKYFSSSTGKYDGFGFLIDLAIILLMLVLFNTSLTETMNLMGSIFEITDEDDPRKNTIKGNSVSNSPLSAANIEKMDINNAFKNFNETMGFSTLQNKASTLRWTKGIVDLEKGVTDNVVQAAKFVSDPLVVPVEKQIEAVADKIEGVKDEDGREKTFSELSKEKSKEAKKELNVKYFGKDGAFSFIKQVDEEGKTESVAFGLLGGDNSILGSPDSLIPGKFTSFRQSVRGGDPYDKLKNLSDKKRRELGDDAAYERVTGRSVVESEDLTAKMSSVAKSGDRHGFVSEDIVGRLEHGATDENLSAEDREASAIAAEYAVAMNEAFLETSKDKFDSTFRLDNTFTDSNLEKFNSEFEENLKKVSLRKRVKIKKLTKNDILMIYRNPQKQLLELAKEEIATSKEARKDPAPTLKVEQTEKKKEEDSKRQETLVKKEGQQPDSQRPKPGKPDKRGKPDRFDKPDRPDKPKDADTTVQRRDLEPQKKKEEKKNPVEMLQDLERNKPYEVKLGVMLENNIPRLNAGDELKVFVVDKEGKCAEKEIGVVVLNNPVSAGDTQPISGEIKVIKDNITILQTDNVSIMQTDNASILLKKDGTVIAAVDSVVILDASIKDTGEGGTGPAPGSLEEKQEKMRKEAEEAKKRKEKEAKRKQEEAEYEAELKRKQEEKNKG
ncbi:MAG: type IV secretion system protein [Rickettsiales bacterium]|jgi:type IV secretory pathway VirB6-like protein|nr:type IV secretion system protein [Rickettsiales bacterium]